MADSTTEIKTGPRFSALGELRKNMIPNFFSPVPSMETLRDWFDRASIPRFKANPAAKRGGGQVYYNVSAVEKFLTKHTMGKVYRGNKN